MSKTKITWIVIVAIVVIIALYVLSAYNGLVTLNEGVDNKWAQVEAQYQRRFDLIPNLVESVKGAMNQEVAVFTAIANARTQYAGARDTNAKVQAAGQVESALSRLLVIMEQYPVLKSSETVQTLMSQIEGTENRVSVERGRFNDGVRDYNLAVKRFPRSMIAGIFGFSEKAYFESENGSEVAPKVDFSNK